MGLLYKYQEGGSFDSLKRSVPSSTKRGTGDNISGEYDQILDSVIKYKGGSKDQYEDLMNSIAFHESKHLVDNGSGGKDYKYLDYKAKQVGGGPGSGAFMFEKGEGAGGATAAKRAVNYYNKIGKEIPTWLNSAASSNNVDASTLKPEQQKILFLTNYMEHPKADLGKVISGEVPIVDFWGQYHQTQNDPHKKDNFNKDYELYKKMYSDNDIAKYQIGGKVINTILENKDLNFVKRMYTPNPKTLYVGGSKEPSTHLMSTGEQDGKYYAFPTIIEKKDGSLYHFDEKKDGKWAAMDHGLKTGEIISFNNEKDAQKFAEGSWKKQTFKAQKGKGLLYKKLN